MHTGEQSTPKARKCVDFHNNFSEVDETVDEKLMVNDGSLTWNMKLSVQNQSALPATYMVHKEAVLAYCFKLYHKYRGEREIQAMTRLGKPAPDDRLAK